MGRIVRSGAPATSTDPAIPVGSAKAQSGDAGVGANTQAGGNAGDGYLDRVAKYVPAEIVAFFIFVNGILSDSVDKIISKADAEKYPVQLESALQSATMAGINVWWISLVMFVIGLLLTPLYFMAVQKPEDKQEHVWINVSVSMLAFPFWAYAIDAVVFRPWHDGALASIALATFTIVSGAIKPGMFSQFKKLRPGGDPAA